MYLIFVIAFLIIAVVGVTVACAFFGVILEFRSKKRTRRQEATTKQSNSFQTGGVTLTFPPSAVDVSVSFNPVMEKTPVVRQGSSGNDLANVYGYSLNFTSVRETGFTAQIEGDALGTSVEITKYDFKVSAHNPSNSIVLNGLPVIVCLSATGEFRLERRGLETVSFSRFGGLHGVTSHPCISRLNETSALLIFEIDKRLFFRILEEVGGALVSSRPDGPVTAVGDLLDGPEVATFEVLVPLNGNPIVVFSAAGGVSVCTADGSVGVWTSSISQQLQPASIITKVSRVGSIHSLNSGLGLCWVGSTTDSRIVLFRVDAEVKQFKHQVEISRDTPNCQGFGSTIINGSLFVTFVRDGKANIRRSKGQDCAEMDSEIEIFKSTDGLMSPQIFVFTFKPVESIAVPAVLFGLRSSVSSAFELRCAIALDSQGLTWRPPVLVARLGIDEEIDRISGVDFGETTFMNVRVVGPSHTRVISLPAFGQINATWSAETQA